MDRNRTVAGLDVHKDSIYLCIMGHDEAIIYEKTYGVLTPELRQMCQDMVERGVTEAAMESTAVYWVPVWNELCESMELKLVNPYFIKQLPGRNSDVKDAQWIAECLLKNLIRGSFVPEPVVQDMRKLNRRIFDLQEDITYYTNKLDAALHRCGFRLSNYVCKITGKSYRKAVASIAEGKTDPGTILKCIHGRVINKHGRETLLAAVTASFSQTDITVIRQYWELIAVYLRQSEESYEIFMRKQTTIYTKSRQNIDRAANVRFLRSIRGGGARGEPSVCRLGSGRATRRLRNDRYAPSRPMCLWHVRLCRLTDLRQSDSICD